MHVEIFYQHYYIFSVLRLENMKSDKSKVQKFCDGGKHIYVPTTVREDPQNSLKVGDTVTVSNYGKKIIIDPAEV